MRAQRSVQTRERRHTEKNKTRRREACSEGCTNAVSPLRFVDACITCDLAFASQRAHFYSIRSSQQFFPDLCLLSLFPLCGLLHRAMQQHGAISKVGRIRNSHRPHFELVLGPFFFPFRDFPRIHKVHRWGRYSNLLSIFFLCVCVRTCVCALFWTASFSTGARKRKEEGCSKCEYPKEKNDEEARTQLPVALRLGLPIGGGGERGRGKSTSKKKKKRTLYSPHQ